MRREKVITGAAWGARIILVIVFCAAAIPKILAPHDFALAVLRYQMLPYALVNLLAIYLPWMELVAAVGILFPRLRAGSAFILLGLLVVFTAAISINLYRGIDIACGCFSVKPETGRLGPWNIIRNTSLIVCALVVLKFTRKTAGTQVFQSL